MQLELLLRPLELGRPQQTGEVANLREPGGARGALHEVALEARGIELSELAVERPRTERTPPGAAIDIHPHKGTDAAHGWKLGVSATLAQVVGIPSSPRVRRRLAGLGVAAGLAGAVVAVVMLLPETTPPNSAPTGHQRAQIAQKVDLHVGRAERRAIDATLDRFIPAGVGRRSMTTAWRLAGPEMKAASTLPQWRRFTSPIPYYPVGGTTFHDWTVIDSGRHYVLFNLLVHPRRGLHKSAWVFSGEMVKRGSHWLVNRIYTTAILAAPDRHGQHEIGPADFTSAGAAANTPPPSKPKLPKTWLLAAVGAVGLALLFPFGFGVASLVRGRRARRQYERTSSRALPPLPVGAQHVESGRSAGPLSPPQR